MARILGIDDMSTDKGDDSKNRSYRRSETE
jgi:hypothetical protein